MSDCKSKGRQPSGETVHNAKLTQEQVDLMRTSQLTNREYACLFSVHESTISRARRGLRYV